MAINGTRVWKWLAIYEPDLEKEVQWFLSDGSPNGVQTADKGSICSDITNGIIYTNTDGLTGWSALSTGGGSELEEGYIRNFIGKDAPGAETPDYQARVAASANWIGNNDDLELAIAKTDAKTGPAFTPETRTKEQLAPSTDTIMALLSKLDSLAGNDAQLVSVNYVALANSIYQNLSALDAQVKVNANAIAIGQTWREYCIGATADAGLNAAADDTALSTLLPFSDDDDGKLPIGAFSDGDVLLSKNDAGTDKIFRVFDDAGTLRVTTVGIDPLAEGDTFVTKYYLPDPSGGENSAIVYYDGTNLVKIADVDWQLATGINLSGTYAVAGTAAAPAPGDTVETAISKLHKDANDIRATTGTARGDTDMGVYTGDVLTDNQSAKANIQELSDAIEAGGPVFTQAGVGATPVTLDSVPLADADLVVWDVKAIGVTSGLQRWAGSVYALHDGVSIIDSTVIPLLRLGTPPLLVDVDVDISAGEMRLRVDSDTAGGANFTAVRRTAI
jgi:hypothetical protein